MTMTATQANIERHNAAYEGEQAAYRAILVEVQKIQPSADILDFDTNTPFCRITLDGNDEDVQVKVSALRDAKRSHMFATFYNGKYGVVVSCYPNTQMTFKSRKDGLPYAEIAKAIFDVARQAKKKAEARRVVLNKREEMMGAAKRLCEKFEFNYSCQWDIIYTDSEIKLDIHGSPEKIDRIMFLLKTEGLL